MSSETKTKRNKYPGACECGAAVGAGAGELRRSGGKWLVVCGACVAPAREMIGAVYWPNGMGYTECSAEYEDATSALQDAQSAYEAARDDGDENPALYDAYQRASDAVATLQLQGGHVGARVQFDKPDVMTALMGGGRVSVAPGGTLKVVSQ